jgi:hypothetical protein
VSPGRVLGSVLGVRLAARPSLPVAGLGSLTSLFPRDFGKQFVDRLCVVDPHEAAEGTPPFPPNGVLRGIGQPECATDADPHVALRLWIHSSSDVAPDVRVGQVEDQSHE